MAEKIALIFDLIKGERVQGIENLLTSLVREASQNGASQNPEIEKIAKELNRRIDDINSDPELREEFKGALGVYVPVANVIITEIRSGYEGLGERLEVVLADYWEKRWQSLNKD